MTISLITERTKDGIKLTHADGKDAGILAPYCEGNGPIDWQLMVEGKCVGPSRRSLKAAEYDALAYWEDQAARS